MATFSFLDFLTLFGGLAIFLYGMQQGEKNLTKLGGGRLRQIIGVITKNRIAGYCTGFVTTILTQSSSATTVMLVGLASAEVMTLHQSLGVILGADLATTMTLGLFALKFYLFAPLLIIIGFAVSLAKNNRSSLIGKLILAAGFVFYGMGLMSEASHPLRSIPLVEQLLNKSFVDPLTGILAGIAVTALLQSSAATLAIVITLASNYVMPSGQAPDLAQFFPMVLGANIGTCATAFLSLLQAKTEGIRVAWAHLSFKVVGALLALPFIWIFPHINLEHSLPAAIQIAALHTGFNFYLALWFLPLIPFVDKTIKTLIKPHAKSWQKFQTHYLHENVIPFPTLAISQSIREIERMAEGVATMVDDGTLLIQQYNFPLKQRIIEKDDEVDFLRERIRAYLTSIVTKEIDSASATRVHELIMVVSDIEHIGDIIAKNITDYAQRIHQNATPLSTEGKQEIVTFFGQASATLKESFAAFTLNDRTLASAILEKKPLIKKDFSSYFESHMARLDKNKTASLETSSIHIDLLEEIQRINHFSFRLVEHILKISPKQLPT